MITIAMQLGLAPIPTARPAKARRHLMDGSKAEAKVDRTVSATQAMRARRAEIVAMLGADGPMFRREIQEGLTMPATPDQLKRDMTALVKSGLIRARECDGTHRIYWRPTK